MVAVSLAIDAAETRLDGTVTLVSSIALRLAGSERSFDNKAPLIPNHELSAVVGRLTL